MIYDIINELTANRKAKTEAKLPKNSKGVKLTVVYQYSKPIDLIWKGYTAFKDVKVRGVELPIQYNLPTQYTFTTKTVDSIPTNWKIEDVKLGLDVFGKRKKTLVNKDIWKYGKPEFAGKFITGIQDDFAKEYGVEYDEVKDSALESILRTYRKNNERFRKEALPASKLERYFNQDFDNAKDVLDEEDGAAQEWWDKVKNNDINALKEFVEIDFMRGAKCIECKVETF